MNTATANVIPFDFQGVKVRVVMRGSDPWFVRADIGVAVRVINEREFSERLDDDEKGVEIIYTPGGPQSMAVISESGLYKVLGTSRTPEAKTFDRWWRREVMPTIRKTGRYELTADGAGTLNGIADLLHTDVLRVERNLREMQDGGSLQRIEQRQIRFEAELKSARKDIDIIRGRTGYLDAMSEDLHNIAEYLRTSLPSLRDGMAKLMEALVTTTRRVFSRAKLQQQMPHVSRPWSKNAQEDLFK